MAKVLLGIPHRNCISSGTFLGAIKACRNNLWDVALMGGSVATDNFNKTWCKAWNEREQNGYTHYAMMHDDVTAEDWWLDTALELMELHGADVISIVMAIKDGRGVTSTGIITRGTPFVQRLTMKELFELPETFSIADTNRPEELLAVNTGLFVCKIGDWFGDFPGFNLEARIFKNEDGLLFCQFWPEDWQMSTWMGLAGLKVMATRAIETEHIGEHRFSNSKPWGKWDHDEDCHYWKTRKLSEEPAVASV